MMDHVHPDSDAVVEGACPGGQWPALGKLYQKPMGLSSAHLLSPSPPKKGASLPVNRVSPPMHLECGQVLRGFSSTLPHSSNSLEIVFFAAGSA